MNHNEFIINNSTETDESIDGFTSDFIIFLGFSLIIVSFRPVYDCMTQVCTTIHKPQDKPLQDRLVDMEEISDIEGLDECSICLEPLAEQPTIVNLPCSHKFHSLCILEWLNHELICPLCREPIE
jgi:hypothetical protein